MAGIVAYIIMFLCGRLYVETGGWKVVENLIWLNMVCANSGRSYRLYFFQNKAAIIVCHRSMMPIIRF